MLDFLHPYWLAVRRWPLYTGVVVLLLAGFGWLAQHGTRLLGDDNETAETASGGPGNSLTGHGTFYHK